MYRNFKRNNCSTQALIYPAVTPSITVASLHTFNSLCTLPADVSQEAGPRGRSFKRLSNPWINYLCLGETINFATVVQLRMLNSTPTALCYSRGPLIPANFCLFVGRYLTVCSNYGMIIWRYLHTGSICSLLFAVSSSIVFMQLSKAKRTAPGHWGNVPQIVSDKSFIR